MSEPIQSTFYRGSFETWDGTRTYFIEERTWTDPGTEGQAPSYHVDAGYLSGHDFAFDANGTLISGTITNIDYSFSITANADYFDFDSAVYGSEFFTTSISVADLQTFLTQSSAFDEFDNMLSSPASIVEHRDQFDDMLAAFDAFVPEVEPVPEPTPELPPFNIITGDDDSNTLNGTDDDDAIAGLEGRDRMNGGEGNDSLDGGSGRDRLNGGDGDDSLYGGADDDQLRGGDGNDLLDAGGGKNDRLWGDDGNDILINGDGKVRMDGGNGSDAFAFSTGDDGELRIRDFDASEDTLVIGDAMDVDEAWEMFSAHAEQDGSDVVWQDGDLTITLQGVDLAAITAAQFTDALYL